MPSAALTRWQNDRMLRLGHMDAHCAALFAPAAPSFPPAAPVAPPSPPPLAHESLQGYTMLVSGHFQGFCRDLYTECAQLCAAAAPTTMRTKLQAQFAAALALNTGNPTHETIRKDFERFGFSLDLDGAAPGNSQCVTHLGHLNFWRNHVAHQKGSPPPTGVPTLLTLANIQVWRASCNRLAISLDDIMKQELGRILGVAPW